MILRRRAALLGAAAACLPPVRKPHAAPGIVTLADSQGFTKGPFTAFMAPWNRGRLRPGADYDEALTLDPATFPAGSRIEWRWPAAGARDQVRGFLAIDYGDYYNTVPEAPVPSRRAADVATLVCRHDLSIGGDVSGFNAIVNFFLTATPDPNSILFEIEVFLHAPDRAEAYMRSVRSLGTFTSGAGIAWNVACDPSAAHGPDFLFRRADGAGLLAGEVNLREMLAWLASAGAITGGEFFNGMALGVEPQQRDGTLEVRAFAVDYA